MNNIFANIELTEEQLERIERVRACFNMTLTALDEYVPEEKERGIMVEKLEEACMWAIKGISRERIYNIEEVSE